MGTLSKMTKTGTLPTTEPTILSFLRRVVSLSKDTGPDFDREALTAFTTTTQRDIRRRADSQLREIVSRRRTA